MSSLPLDVLLVDDVGPVANAAVDALRQRGHEVRHVATRVEALGERAAQVLVCAVELADSTGLDLLAALRARGSEAHAILLGRLSSPDEMRTALRLDVRELLERPSPVAELIEAVESGPTPTLEQPANDLPGNGELRRSILSEPDDIEDALRELSAFLVRNGVSPTTRMRAATAVSEVLDNVRAHAYPDDMDQVRGRAELCASLSGRELNVRVSDQGQGFESGQDDAGGDPLERGLARAAALSEELRVESVLGFGSCVTLRFHAYTTEFEDSNLLDLCELDWISPALARRVLDGIEDEAQPGFHFSPAQAVAVGRLLAGRSDHQRATRELWRA